jgi:ABC-2 type transport system ATP-binding protein
LHGGRIIANGTLAELQQLLPPATVEYVQKQPTLEEVFLAIVGDHGIDDGAAVSPASASTSEEQR